MEEAKPVHPYRRGAQVIGLALFFVVLDTLVVGLRIWVRAWYNRSSKVWGWDDDLALLGYVSHFRASLISIPSFYQSQIWS